MNPPPAAVDEFIRYDVDRAAWPWPVYRHGTGRPVIVIHELMGLTAEVLAFARRLSESGFHTYLPVLFGAVPAETPWQQRRAIARCCISREINILRTGKTSRVVAPLRKLAEHLAGQPGAGNGVGVVGMCMSGGFALALASAPPVVGAVASQPSLPFGTPMSWWCRRDLGMTGTDVADLHHRLGAGEVEVYVARFSADKRSPPQRVAALEKRVGSAGLTIDTIPSGPDNEFGFRPKAHSVLAVAPTQYPSGPAAERLAKAAADVTEFLDRRLSAGDASSGS